MQTVLTCISVGSVGILFGLGAARFPVLWGTVLLAAAAMFSSLWYTYLYHRMLLQMEDEIAAQLTGDRTAPL